MPYGVSGSSIVGIYGDSNNRNQGFRYDGQTWESLMFPGAESTVARGVSGNRIVGFFGNTTGSDNQGFVYDGTNWTTLNYPGARATYPRGVDSSNIVGSYVDSNGHAHGFLYNGSTWVTLDYPGALNTDPTGISGTAITGHYYKNGTNYWFLYDGENWATLLGDPFDVGIGGLSGNHGGISGNRIVGTYNDDSFTTHGFLWDGVRTTNLDYPAGTKYVYTYPKGIEGDQIVGYYYVNMSNTPIGFHLIIPEPAALCLIWVGGLITIGSRK